MGSESASTKRSDWYAALESLLPYSLALILIVAFLVYIGEVIIRQPVDVSLLETLSAVFLGPIGIALGFYFGYRPVEKLDQRIQELIQVNKGMLGQLEQEKYAYEMERGEGASLVKRAIEEREEAVNQMEKLRRLAR